MKLLSGNKKKHLTLQEFYKYNFLFAAHAVWLLLSILVSLDNKKKLVSFTFLLVEFLINVSFRHIRKIVTND